MLLLLVWPYVDRRLVAPLHPFLVAMVVAGAVEVAQRWPGRRASRVVVGVALVWMGGYAVMTTGRIARGWPVSAYRIRADAMATGLETLSRTVPTGSVVGAPELWAALSLHGGWTVVPSARFAAFRSAFDFVSFAVSPESRSSRAACARAAPVCWARMVSNWN